MQYDSMLRVENNSPTLSYIFSFNSKRYIIPPQRTAFVDFDALVVGLGDPRSGPEPSHWVIEGREKPVPIPSRKEELTRLGVQYGVYTTHPDTPASPYFEDVAGRTLRDMMPDVTVYNMSDNEPIVFPIDDPDCNKYLPPETDLSTVASLQRQVEALGRQQAILREQLRQASTGEMALPLEDLPTDSPSPTPPPTRRQPQPPSPSPSQSPRSA